MVPIEFDKPRQLKFDLRALKDLEANMGGQPLAVIISNLMNVGITATTVALWAGLKHEDPTLTISLATKMLQKYIDDGKSLRVLGRALARAIEETGLLRGEDDEEPEGNVTTTEKATA